jgi:hypothetical protein
VLREAEMKRLNCAGIILLSKDQAHWSDGLEYLTRSAPLVQPVTMKLIVKRLTELVPISSSAADHK